MAIALLLATWLLAACEQPSSTQQSARGIQTPATISTASPSITAPPLYVTLGASDAFGVGTDHPAKDNWPTVLAEDIGERVHMVNLGIPGATLSLATRIELPIALDEHPDVVIIWLAVNDIEANVPLAQYTQELRTMLAALKNRTQARIFVGNVPDLSLLPFFAKDDPSALQSRVQDWNAAIAATCSAEGAVVVDLYTGWSALAEHPEYISSDGLHPSTVGAQRLAQIFVSAIYPSARVHVASP